MNTTELLIIAEALHMALTKENNYTNSDYETLAKAADIVDGHLGINIPMKDLEEVTLVKGEAYWIEYENGGKEIGIWETNFDCFVVHGYGVELEEVTKLQHIPRPSDNDINNAKEILDKLDALLDTKRN